MSFENADTGIVRRVFLGMHGDRIIAVGDRPTRAPRSWMVEGCPGARMVAEAGFLSPCMLGPYYKLV